MEWAGKTIHDQVAAVQDVDIMLTVMGSMAMNAMFLREGTALVVPCRTNGGVAQPDVEFPLLHNFQHWVKTIEICGDSFTNIAGDWAMHANETAIVQVMEALEADHYRVIANRIV